MFITTLAQYAVKGYEVDAMDYLIKPVSYEKVCLRLKKALQRVSRFEEHYMLLPVEDTREKVAVEYPSVGVNTDKSSQEREQFLRAMELAAQKYDGSVQITEEENTVVRIVLQEP